MYSFWGKILVVDLSRKTVEVLEKDAAYCRKYMGGALLCARLFEELGGQKASDALAPENPLIFAPGPLAGQSVCGATRVNVLSCSPESGSVYLSRAGGEFGPAIKRAGVDALAVVGRSELPLTLVVHNHTVRFDDAAGLWGQDRVEAAAQLTAKLGDNFTVATIGVAGENQVRHANIMFEPDHYAGRGGLGAIMGAKGLKAIAVGGDKRVAFANPTAVETVNRDGGSGLAAALKKSPDGFMAVLRNYGTFGLLELNQKMGNLPTRNFSAGQPDNPADGEGFSRKVGGKKHVGQRKPCRHCFVACKKRPKSRPDHTALAEYESIALLGPNLGIAHDLELCLEICDQCNRLGLDTISTGNLIAWLMDCFEHGVLDEKALGISIRFGEGEKALAVIKAMANRAGDLGDLLANGITAAVAKLGPATAPYVRSINGVGMPAHMPRKKPGIGLAYLHGPNPSDHMKIEHDWIASDPDSLKAFGLEVASAPDALDAAKVDVIRTTQFYYGAMETLSLCLFVFGPGNVYTFDQLVGLVNAATGFDVDFAELMIIGERAVQLQRKLFLETGGQDADLPQFMTEEIPRGPSKGARIRTADFENARRHYYTIMGWDETGTPTAETLARLEI
jgi:aldehyde:ferredoxin oxidoreductase